MADAKLSAVPLPVHATPHPMANPGYGKRSAPEQLAHTSHDFSHLPAREAAVAAYIDRLPDGADISVKTLAKVLPYGQCALRTALNLLQEHGHLRRGREHLIGSASARWVTLTWFSRTARGNDWWAAFASGESRDRSRRADRRDDGPPGIAPQDQDRQDGARGHRANGHESPPQRPTRSRAFLLLAALGRAAPALSLSAADCAELAPLAARWFERGATEEDVLRALTAGLPTPVHSPAGLTRNRLTTKLPPEPPVAVTRRPPLRVLECAKCGTPGRPEALPDGLCGTCRGEHVPYGSTPRHPRPLAPAQVRIHADRARAAAARRPEVTRV